MPESRPSLTGASDTGLEDVLFALAPHVAYPTTPDVANSVRAQIEPGFVPASAPRAFVPRRRALWLAAAALLIALLGGLALFPEVRTAIADRLGLRGVIIRWVEETQPPPPSPVGARMMLGRLVTLAEARAAVDFPIHLPAREELAEPREIYISGAESSAMVSFVYPASDRLPVDPITGVGALLSQFPGATERDFIMKGLGLDGGEGESTLESVTVNGGAGFWIAGVPHGVFLVCTDAGSCREEHYRLAGNVLLWEQDGLTFRLESALPRDEAMAIAGSVSAAE